MKTAFLAILLLLAGGASAQGTVYRCPGSPESYTNLLTAEQAKERGCRTVEGAPITIVQTVRPRPAASAASDARVAPAEQRARDSDARRILNDELQRTEGELSAMRKDYNNGQPERLGSERNYQRYLDRVAGMKTAIERKEADVAALKRELAKLAP
jgi:hypothetical protein